MKLIFPILLNTHTQRERERAGCKEQEKPTLHGRGSPCGAAGGAKRECGDLQAWGPSQVREPVWYRPGITLGDLGSKSHSDLPAARPRYDDQLLPPPPELLRRRDSDKRTTDQDNAPTPILTCFH